MQTRHHLLLRALSVLHDSYHCVREARQSWRFLPEAVRQELRAGSAPAGHAVLREGPIRLQLRPRPLVQMTSLTMAKS